MTVRPPLGLRVLAADDETINRVVLGHQLAKLGCTHRILAKGEDVIAQLDATLHDVVLLYVCMPNLGGQEVARRIRSLSWPAAHIPIILMTAHAESAPQDLGRCSCLLKPLSLTTLHDTLATFVRRPSGS